MVSQVVDSKSTEPIGLRFQLLKTAIAGQSVSDIHHLPCKPSQLPPLALAAEVPYGAGPVWAKVDQHSVKIVKDHKRATIGLVTVQRGFFPQRVLINLGEEVLLNGTPTLSFSVLESKDSIFLTKAGILLYLTEQFRPYVGCPDEQSGLIGQVCPCCSIEIQSEPPTQVVTCCCGAVYHHETEETHPDLEPKERLSCLKKIKFCLHCGKELSSEEKLVWDPTTL